MASALNRWGWPTVLPLCVACAGCAVINDPQDVSHLTRYFSFVTRYYYFAPQLAETASTEVAYAADHATLNATFKSSGNNLSITTYTTTDNRLVVHLWIAASCLEAHKWLLFPGATRIYDVTRGDRVPIPLRSFLQYHPGVMRPGSSGVAAEVGYLDRGSPLECHGRTVAAASATFAIDSATRQLAVSLRDVVRDDSGAPLQVPDVSLTLTVENERNDREGVPILLAPSYGWGR